MIIMAWYKKVFGDVVDFYSKLFAGEIDIPFSNKKEINLTPEKKEELKEQIVEQIYKNKESIKSGKLEEILEPYMDAEKIGNFLKAIKGKDSITKEDFKKLL